VHVVRQVIDRREPRAARMLIDAGKRHEVDVVDRYTTAIRRRITIDEIDQRIADALDRRNAEFHRSGPRLDTPRALLHGPAKRERRILDPKRHGANRRAVHAREALCKTVRLGIDDEIDAALPIEQYVLRTMLRDRRKTHLLEQATQRGRIRRGILDELKAVGAERIIPERWRRSWHGELLR